MKVQRIVDKKEWILPESSKKTEDKLFRVNKTPRVQKTLGLFRNIQRLVLRKEMGKGEYTKHSRG